MIYQNSHWFNTQLTVWGNIEQIVYTGVHLSLVMVDKDTLLNCGLGLFLFVLIIEISSLNNKYHFDCDKQRYASGTTEMKLERKWENFQRDGL